MPGLAVNNLQNNSEKFNTEGSLYSVGDLKYYNLLYNNNIMTPGVLPNISDHSVLKHFTSPPFLLC